MKYLHTMVRVTDIDKSLYFYCKLLGLNEVRVSYYEIQRYTLVYLAVPGDDTGPQIELTHNWDQDEDYSFGRNFGHIAYEVDNIYDICERMLNAGVIITRPPRDGHMAFVVSPDGVQIELLQKRQRPNTM